MLVLFFPLLPFGCFCGQSEIVGKCKHLSFSPISSSQSWFCRVVWVLKESSTSPGSRRIFADFIYFPFTSRSSPFIERKRFGLGSSSSSWPSSPSWPPGRASMPPPHRGECVCACVFAERYFSGKLNRDRGLPKSYGGGWLHGNHTQRSEWSEDFSDSVCLLTVHGLGLFDLCAAPDVFRRADSLR